MRNTTRSLIGGMLMVGPLVLGQWASAEEGHALDRVQNGAMNILGQAASEQQLEEHVGRQDTAIERLMVQMNDTELNGQLSENTLQSTSTGFNTVGADAFSQANGVSTVIQNSGNQVLIQNSTILNLTVK